MWTFTFQSVRRPRHTMTAVLCYYSKYNFLRRFSREVFVQIGLGSSLSFSYTAVLLPVLGLV